MKTAPLVRLVDDDVDLLAAQTQALRIAGFRTEPFDTAAAALQGLTADFPGVILSDVRMPQIDGFGLFRRVQAIDPDLPVILLTGHGDVPMAVSALKAGAYDFLTKPAGQEDLTAALRRALAARALVLENRMLRQMRRDDQAGHNLLPGETAVMVHLRQTVARVAEAGVDALITGPGGVGKETVARAIHAHSDRRARGFVHVACASLDPARLEAELFGEGASVSRQSRPAGRIEKAHRGTLFLNEVDALSPALQARLLSVIETGELWSQGAAAPRALDLRVIAATRADLAQMAGEGHFRSDLYYRISGVVLQVPPLAARREDAPLLFRQFLLAACQRLDLPVPPLTALIRARLLAHSWPGNLRELRQYAEYTALGLSPFAPGEGSREGPGLNELVAGYEAELIREALRLHEGNVTRALESLQLPRKTFYDKLARHAIRAADFRP